MSASVPPPASGTQPAGAASDPSMEDILASIRRILSEDEQPAKPANTATAAAPAMGDPALDDDVLPLDDSMLVAEPAANMPDPHDTAAALIAAMSEPGEPLEAVELAPLPVAPLPIVPPVAIAPPVPAPPVIASPPPFSDRLINAEAEAATAGSVNTLLRTLESGRQAASMAVYRGGPTLEDMVREELRALLTTWLDANLPPLVERLVRAEIKRVVSRAVG